MIASDNDSCDKFFAVINDTGEQFSLVTTTPVIKFSPVSLILVRNIQKA
jgi:hypothetical protein